MSVRQLWGRWRALVAGAVLLGAAAVWAGTAMLRGAPERPALLAAMLPQGALLAIESPDFATLLHAWEQSPEEASWLKSDSYGTFSRSRLFGRLADAQAQFAAAAGLAPDGAFLDQIAGGKSIFAWYDIGKLEFLYITQLAPGKAEQTQLLQARSSFSRRQVGGSTFYVRTRGETPRTVAFALSGDTLLLSTREDLMANALSLIEHASGDSLATEPWFVDLDNVAAKAGAVPALRMSLNLERIVRTPYFRSYWVQRNVTEMSQYRAAVVDLYREPTQMREERVLLAKSADDAGLFQGELGDLVALVPRGAGVYRAVATSDASVAADALDEKLLRRGVGGFGNRLAAPNADLAMRETGVASDLETGDLETRIDAAAPVVLPAGAEMELLRGQIAAAGLTGMLTVDLNEVGQSDAGGRSGSTWIPFHSAVALRAAKPWDEGGLQRALQQALQARLSTAGLGLQWSGSPGGAQAAGYASLGEVRPLQMAVRGNLLLLTDDAGVMEAMLARVRAGGAPAMPATLVAGFDHAASAGAFARFSGLVDKADKTEGGAGTKAVASDSSMFFSGNLRSLSRTFAAMQSERVVERREGALTRQTVTYVWAR